MAFNPRSLFIQVFLWFWLVTVVTGGALFVFALIGDHARNREIREQHAEERRLRLAQTLSFYGETALGLVDRGGVAAIDAYGKQLARTAGIRPYFFLTPDRPPVGVPSAATELAARASRSGQTEYSLDGDLLLLAQPLRNGSGQWSVVVGETSLAPGAPPPVRARNAPPPEAVEACAGRQTDDACSFLSPRATVAGTCQVLVERELACVPSGGHHESLRQPPRPDGPGPPPGGADGGEKGWLANFSGDLDRYSRNLGKNLLILFIIGGGACYLLTWRLTAPLRRLRQVAQQLAGGDLSARVGEKFARRGDEIADLGADLDRMAQQIETLIDAQKRLLRDISHELRSPLARLNVALELARRSAGEEAGGSLDRIERESHRLNEMIGQLLLLTKLENGSEHFGMSEIDLTQLLAEIARDADFEARGRQCAVAIVESSPLVLSGNREMLRQALENVIRNAVRYTAARTTVEITLKRIENSAGGWVRIEVRDHGPGVPEAELTKVFLPFHRVADARERESGGVGVGLAISARAVRLHGGSIEAINLVPSGLSVRIDLPLARS